MNKEKDVRKANLAAALSTANTLPSEQSDRFSALSQIGFPKDLAIPNKSETDMIWGESSSDGLLLRFSEILFGTYGSQKFSVFRVFNRGNVLKISPFELSTSNQPTFDEKITKVLENQVTSRLFDDKDVYSEIETFDFEGEILSFVGLSSDIDCELICLWQGQQGIQISSNKNLFRLTNLISQIQNEYRWYSKLEVTQSKIFKDDLTQLHNYRFLNQEIDSELKRADRFQYEFSLVFIDIDDFKPVNDNYGHQAGSAVLKQVGEVLNRLLREIDGIFRYGGDEFVVMLLGADCSSAVQVAERIRESIATNIFDLGDGKTTQLTVSVGVSTYPTHGTTKKALLQLADKSMYKSKESGKNQVVAADEFDEKDLKSV